MQTLFKEYGVDIFIWDRHQKKEKKLGKERCYIIIKGSFNQENIILNMYVSNTEYRIPETKLLEMKEEIDK